MPLKRRNEMVDTAAIRNRMRFYKIRLQDVADALGLSVNSVENKLKNGNWDLVEAWRLCQYLRLDVMETIFAHTDTVEILKESDWGYAS